MRHMFRFVTLIAKWGCKDHCRVGHPARRQRWQLRMPSRSCHEAESFLSGTAACSGTFFISSPILAVRGIQKLRNERTYARTYQNSAEREKNLAPWG
jgi:hypothetical protein